jgi:RNA polymerase sigma-70 factor (ECF subfamily)
MNGSTNALARPRGWDDELVPRCVAGDGAAWRAFHRHHYPIAVAFLRKLGVREPELDDACQEVFLQVHRYLPRFRGEAEVKTWFYRLCVTEARRTRTRGRLVKALRGWFHAHPPDTTVPAATRSDVALLDLIGKALDAMNEGERLVFVLFEMEGLPGKEVAAIAGCPEATLWRRLHHARGVFRGTLDEPANTGRDRREVRDEGR